MIKKIFTLLILSTVTFITAFSSPPKDNFIAEDKVEYEGTLLSGGPLDLGRQRFSDDGHRFGIEFYIEDSQEITRWQNNMSFYDILVYHNEAYKIYYEDQWTKGDHIVIIRDQDPWWVAINLTRNNSTLYVLKNSWIKIDGQWVNTL